METRKIIAFGKSTRSITLPKKWIDKNKLMKGDTVSLIELSSGRLEVVPSSRKLDAKTKTITIPIQGRPIKEIQREFIAAYIKGYSVIHLAGSHEGKISEIRRRLHELIAVEIMEVAPQRITAKVFFDASIVSLPNIISRVEIITRTILEETSSLLKKNNNLEIAYKELVEKKREVDRQSLFAIRIIVNALTDPVFASTIDADTLKLSFGWHLIEYVEKISDYLLTAAFYMVSTDVMKKLGKKGRDELHTIFSNVGMTFDNSLKSYNKNSPELANKVFDMHSSNDKHIFKYVNKNLILWVPLISHYLRRISSRSRDIAKITINLNTN
ncbi:MAG: hypothetical protein ISS93_03820 [Candidatus Aenigmarchaeota archaeon]|nr:hypothetical protein [Candidatus Aenigmarchaeota archaeon]